MEEKIARLEKTLILETRSEERFRLEHKIQALKENPTDFLSLQSLKNNKNQYVIKLVMASLFLLVILFVWKNNKLSFVESQALFSFKIIGLQYYYTIDK